MKQELIIGILVFGLVLLAVGFGFVINEFKELNRQVTWMCYNSTMYYNICNKTMPSCSDVDFSDFWLTNTTKK